MQCCVLQTTPLGPGEDDLPDVLDAVQDNSSKMEVPGNSPED